MLHVEDRKHKLGVFVEIDRQKLLARGAVLKALPGRLLKVTVMDAYLKPLAGAKVYMSAAYAMKSAESLAGTTNSAGELTVPPVYRGGKYTFRATLLGYCPAQTGAPAVGSENWIDSIEIVTEPATGVVRGKVTDRNGKPVEGAKVTTDFGPSAVSDDKGEFTLRQMPPRNVVLEARKGALRGTNLDYNGRVTRDPEPVIVLR